MFSKIKKVLGSLVLVASLALAPMSNVSAGSRRQQVAGKQGGLPIHEYFRVEAAMIQLGLNFSELNILNSVGVVTYNMAYYSPKIPINKSKVLTSIDNVLNKTPRAYKTYVTDYKRDIKTAYNKITKKLQDEPDEQDEQGVTNPTTPTNPKNPTTKVSVYRT